MLHFLFRQIVVHYKIISQQYFARLSLGVCQVANVVRYPVGSEMFYLFNQGVLQF